MGSDDRIVAREAIPEDSTFVFRVSDDGERKEAILVRLEEDVVGWLNYCQHFTHIKLDKGSGAEMRDGEIVCTNHGAYFESDTGRCSFGPCEGAYLNEIEVTTADGDVYLTDDDFELLGVGPLETDDDLVSKSNFEF
ncbi:MAG: Rieske 2Fe-2S domain-containing protein [Natronomonas sp.]